MLMNVNMNVFLFFQVPDSVPAHQHQILTYRIKDLLPFTVYRAAVACRQESSIRSEWSSWSPDITAETLDRGNG